MATGFEQTCATDLLGWYILCTYGQLYYHTPCMTHVKSTLDFEQLCSKCGGKIKMIAAVTSCEFVADLPSLDPDQLSKLYTWGKHACTRLDVHMKGEGLTLVAERKKPGTVRELQRLLRTNLLNWGVGLPAKRSGWLRLVPTNEDANAQREKAGARV